MIEAIKEIGEYSLKKKNKDLDNPLDILIENPDSNGSYKHTLAIKISIDAYKNLTYDGIDHLEFSKNKITKYLYKKGSSNGPDITPTAKVTQIEKTFNNKILGWFTKTAKESKDILEKGELNFLYSLKGLLEANKEDIINELNEKNNSIDNNEKSIITFVFQDDGDQKYLGDYSLFKKVMLERGTSDFYYKYGVTSKGFNKICSICKNESEQVFGFASPYKFYTVDKPGFVAGGFDQSKAWQNNPVCLNCALKLLSGKEYMEKYLSFRAQGFDYFLIPKLLEQGYSEEVFSTFEDFKNKKLAISSKYGNFLQTKENDILDILSEENNYLNLNFLFYKQSNSQFDILLHIQDILPSRLRKLFEAKKKTDNKSLFKNYTISSGESKPILFTLGNLRWFFPYRSDKPDNNKYFLEIVNSIFTGKRVDYSFLLKHIIDLIRDEFKDGNPTKYTSLVGLQLLDYLNGLKLLNSNREVHNMNSKDLSELLNNNNEYEDNYEYRSNLIFSEFSDFFNTDAKKAVFLEGILAQYLLNIQWQNRGNTPFINKLKSLNLDERHVKRLLPEIQNKLEEYGANYYKNLESLISKYMLQAGNSWKLSNDEISFYFVLGMNLANYLKPQNQENTDNEEAEVQQ